MCHYCLPTDLSLPEEYLPFAALKLMVYYGISTELSEDILSQAPELELVVLYSHDPMDRANWMTTWVEHRNRRMKPAPRLIGINSTTGAILMMSTTNMSWSREQIWDYCVMCYDNVQDIPEVESETRLVRHESQRCFRSSTYVKIRYCNALTEDVVEAPLEYVMNIPVSQTYEEYLESGRLHVPVFGNIRARIASQF